MRKIRENGLVLLLEKVNVFQTCLDWVATTVFWSIVKSFQKYSYGKFFKFVGEKIFLKDSENISSKIMDQIERNLFWW